MQQGIKAIISIVIISGILVFASSNGINESIKVKLSIVDDKGIQISNSSAQSSNEIFSPNEKGVIQVALKGSGPDVLLVSAPGYLTEIVPIGWENNNGKMKIKLFPDGDGKRIVMNFGGDVFLGRRFLEKPLTSGLNETEMSKSRALNVVAYLKRAFSSADISMVNLETVIGRFDVSEAYDNKLHLLQSPPESTDALRSMGVDLVTLANNHTADWKNQGVDSTLMYLKEAGIIGIGAGIGDAAKEPAILERNGIRVGTLAYTTVKTQNSANDVTENIQSDAADWSFLDSTKEIQDLRMKADIIVVQIHGGYQYKAAPAATLVSVAHAAIDAGADIVISHHPHVLQGMEWYKGHLIVYSLGNLVFDQDFLETFSSGFLRTIWEDGKLLEARFIPVELVEYNPILVTDESARQIIAKTWEKSLLISQSVMRNNIVYSIIKPIGEFSKPVHFRFENGTARLTQIKSEGVKAIEINSKEVIQLNQSFLWPARMGLDIGAPKDQLTIGRDLFSWGSFEDTLADAVVYGGIHMKLRSPDKQWTTEQNEESKNSFLHISRKKGDSQTTLIRPIARIPLVTNRLFSDTLVALDSKPEYSIRLKVKGSGDILARLRVDSYWFFDSNPGEEPISELLDQYRYDLSIIEKGWQTIEIPIEPSFVNDKSANSIMVYFEMDPPNSGNSFLDIDDLEVIEWRDAASMPDIYGAFTHIKNKGQTNLNLNIKILKSE